jgi:hypothetical protein
MGVAMNKVISDCLTEPDGKWSLGRIGFAFALGFGFWWVSCIVIATHTMPDLAGLGIFIGVPFGISKAATVYSASKTATTSVTATTSEPAAPASTGG